MNLLYAILAYIRMADRLSKLIRPFQAVAKAIIGRIK
jgi:hypothetical protein